VPFKRTHKKVPSYLNKQQLSKLSKSVVDQEKKDTTKNDFERARNILIVRLFIYSGIKTSELLSLQDDDFVMIDSKTIELNIKGSSASKRVIPIPRGKFIEYCNTYIKDKQVGRDSYFFYSPSNPNKKLNSEIVVNLIKKHFKLAKISNSGGATSIRNGYAIYLDRVKYPLVKIQKLMGHSNIRTTRDLVMLDSPELLKTADIFDALDKI
jgi:integrase/recombinase XerD